MARILNQAALPPVLALAYIGDARHSLFVRKLLLSQGAVRSGELNKLSLNFVTAAAQAKAFLRIEAMLTEDERDVYRRAFNSTHLNKPKHASGKEYRMATGFEAVIGMLEYFGDEARIEELLTVACDNKGDKDYDTEN